MDKIGNIRFLQEQMLSMLSDIPEYHDLAKKILSSDDADRDDFLNEISENLSDSLGMSLTECRKVLDKVFIH